MIPLATPDLSGNELKYLTECIETGYVTHAGRFERAFEEAFGKRFNTTCIATSSGTGALHLALLSLGIGPGDEVIVPDLTFGATASAVLAVGAKPVLVDIDEGTWGLDKHRIATVLNRRTRAILPVHLYGENGGSFTQFGVPVIEDSCEALGLVPHTGRLQCYSFYGNKIITTGEGGMVCGSPEDLEKVREWRDGGFDHEYRNTIPGLNYRLSNMQAAVGLGQIERFDELLSMRLRNVATYAEHLKGKGKWLFVAQVDNPMELARQLKENGIETRPVFTPLHRSPAFRQYAKGKYKVSDSVWEHGLALPTGPHLTKEKQERIIDLVRGYRSKLAA